MRTFVLAVLLWTLVLSPAQAVSAAPAEADFTCLKAGNVLWSATINGAEYRKCSYGDSADDIRYTAGVIRANPAIDFFEVPGTISRLRYKLHGTKWTPAP